jgi:hypothetical protein
VASAADKLLYVVSARSEMSWSSFKDSADAVHEQDRPPTDDGEHVVSAARRVVLASLDQLGHVTPQFGSGAARIFAEPPQLALLPVAGLPRAVLTGARSPQTVEAVRETSRAVGGLRVTINDQRGTGPRGPQRIGLLAESVDLLSRCAAELGIRLSCLSSEALSGAAGVSAYEEQLEWVEEPELEWPRWDLDIDQLAFTPRQSRDDLRLSAYKSPTTGQFVHRLRRGRSAAPVDRVWGTWLYLRMAGREVISYDPARALFAVPAYLSLPRRVGRALTLASGYAPIVSREAPGLAVYCWVPRRLAREAAELLGQRLAETEVVIPYPTE